MRQSSQKTPMQVQTKTKPNQISTTHHPEQLKSYSFQKTSFKPDQRQQFLNSSEMKQKKLNTAQQQVNRVKNVQIYQEKGQSNNHSKSQQYEALQKSLGVLQRIQNLFIKTNQSILKQCQNCKKTQKTEDVQAQKIKMKSNNREQLSMIQENKFEGQIIPMLSQSSSESQEIVNSSNRSRDKTNVKKNYVDQKKQSHKQKNLSFQHNKNQSSGKNQFKNATIKTKHQESKRNDGKQIKSVSFKEKVIVIDCEDQPNIINSSHKKQSTNSRLYNESPNVKNKQVVNEKKNIIFSAGDAKSIKCLLCPTFAPLFQVLERSDEISAGYRRNNQPRIECPQCSRQLVIKISSSKTDHKHDLKKY